MKRIAVLSIVVFVTLFVVSACNNSTCPAYSNVDTELSEEIA